MIVKYGKCENKDCTHEGELTLCLIDNKPTFLCHKCIARLNAQKRLSKAQ
jgi:uncharacterized protein YlaI